MLYAVSWKTIKKQKYTTSLPPNPEKVPLLINKQKQGLRVPQVLRKYIPGQPEFIPYVKELAKNSTSAKTKAGVKLGSTGGKHGTKNEATGTVVAGAGAGAAAAAGTAKAKVEEAVNGVAEKLQALK